MIGVAIVVNRREIVCVWWWKVQPHPVLVALQVRIYRELHRQTQNLLFELCGK